jgi:hypothetical protein
MISMPLSSTSVVSPSCEVGLAAAEDLDEQRAEVLADLLEGLREHVDRVSELIRLITSSNWSFALTRSSCCGAEEVETLLGLLVFLDGHQVDRARFRRRASAGW